MRCPGNCGLNTPLSSAGVTGLTTNQGILSAATSKDSFSDVGTLQQSPNHTDANEEARATCTSANSNANSHRHTQNTTPHPRQRCRETAAAHQHPTNCFHQQLHSIFLDPTTPQPLSGGGVTWSNDLHVGHMNEVTSSPPLAGFELLPGRTTIRLPVILLRWNVLSLRGGHRFLSQAYQTHGPSNAKTDTMNH